MKCPKCGCELPNQAKFCSQCGAKVPVEPGQADHSEYKPDMDRFERENGSGNFWMHYDEDVSVFYNINTDTAVTTSDGIIMFDTEDGEKEIILKGHTVDSFRVSASGFIVFSDRVGNEYKPRFELWYCNWAGEEVKLIAGDSKDNVRFFTVTDDWIFAVLENKKGQQFIYQISSDLKSAAVIKKDVHICWQIAADAEFLYYMTGYPKEVSLMQYDIRNKTERAILKNKGLSRFQLYRKHLIVATYETIGAYGGDDGEKLILISLKQMKQRSLSAERIALNELTCYLDFAFYIEKKTGFIYALPLTGGTPQLVYKREAVKLNISRGVLDFIDYDREQRICVPIVAQAGGLKDNIPGYTGYKIPLPNVSNSGAEPDYLAMKTQPILQSQLQSKSKETPEPQHPFWGANQEAAEKFLEKTNVCDQIYIRVEDQMTPDFSKMLSILRSLTILRNAKEVNLFSGNVKNHLTFFPFDFTLNQREKQIKQYCAKCHVQLQQGEVPYYFLDTTSFCTKAHGIVATNYGLYLSDPRKDNPLLYQNITAMPCGMMDSMEIIYNGKNAKVKLPCDEVLNNFLIFTCMYFKYGQG